MKKIKFSHLFEDFSREPYPFKRVIRLPRNSENDPVVYKYEDETELKWDDQVEKILRIATMEDYKKFKFFYDPKQDGLLFPVLEVRKITSPYNDIFIVYYLDRQDPETLRHELIQTELISGNNDILWEKNQMVSFLLDANSIQYLCGLTPSLFHTVPLLTSLPSDECSCSFDIKF